MNRCYKHNTAVKHVALLTKHLRVDYLAPYRCSPNNSASATSELRRPQQRWPRSDQQKSRALRGLLTECKVVPFCRQQEEAYRIHGVGVVARCLLMPNPPLFVHCVALGLTGSWEDLRACVLCACCCRDSFAGDTWSSFSFSMSMLLCFVLSTRGLALGVVAEFTWGSLRYPSSPRPEVGRHLCSRRGNGEEDAFVPPYVHAYNETTLRSLETRRQQLICATRLRVFYRSSATKKQSCEYYYGVAAKAFK